MRFLIFAAVALVALLTAAAASAQSTGPVFIDFEFFPGPDGTLGTEDDIPAPDCDVICFNLSDEFEALGLVFTSGTLFQMDFFPDVPATNHFISSSPPDVTLTLSPVFGVSMESYSVHDATLYGFDELGRVIATDTLKHPGGSDFFFGTLEIVSEQPIWRFLALATECELGEPCGPILNLDNFGLLFADAEIFEDGFESGDTTAWSSTTSGS